MVGTALLGSSAKPEMCRRGAEEDRQGPSLLTCDTPQLAPLISLSLSPSSSYSLIYYSVDSFMFLSTSPSGTEACGAGALICFADLYLLAPIDGSRLSIC